MHLRPALAAACLAATACSTPPNRAQIDHQDTPHHLSLFTGATSIEASEDPDTTVGVDYEYRVSDFLGLGGVAEHAFADVDSTTLLAVADLHLTHSFVIQTGPGVEFFSGRGADDPEFVVRTGALYEFEVGHTTVSPQVHYDWAEAEDALVWGLAFGFAF